MFVLFGAVDWPAAGALALGMFFGGLLGPSLARRLPGDLVRWLIACATIAVASGLLLRTSF